MVEKHLWFLPVLKVVTVWPDILVSVNATKEVI
jgi:hypothetical protein